MKIDKQCNGGSPKPVTWREIPSGTVFRHGRHEFGPYLKLTIAVGCAFINLKDATYISVAPNDVVTNYLPLPNAHLVTEEAL